MRTKRWKKFALSLAVLAFPLIAHAEAEAMSGLDNAVVTGKIAHHPSAKLHRTKKASHATKSDGEVGLASWYGGDDAGRRTASGESLDGREFTAAHRTLPLHSKVRVTNLVNGRSIMVRITDRGPHTKGRIIDLSQSAAEQLGMKHSGVARVRIQPESPLLINAAG
jgi:rare lipoprotein A